jgi:hypothetical protein
MIFIKRNRLYDETDGFLKELSCPLKITMLDLKNPESPISHCCQCERAVVNTDHMSEHQLVELLQKQPDTCININRFNPIFTITDKD